ncbi:MAG: hypothetical protein IH822_09165 [Chloroflexi bacterium]|nr:hypothetical protein [Chloroflexota bacterium]
MLIRLMYAIAVAVAGSLALLATFLPWVSIGVEISLLGIRGSVGTITRYGYDGDGVSTLLLGLLAAGFAAYLWFERRAAAFRLVTLFNVFVGALMFAIAIVNLVDSERAVGDALQQLDVNLNLAVDTGEGIYIAIAAGAILALASLVAFSAQRFGLPGLLVEDIGVEPHRSTRVCPRCGTQLPGLANYCLDCGQRLNSHLSGGGSADSVE